MLTFLPKKSLKNNAQHALIVPVARRSGEDRIAQHEYGCGDHKITRKP